MAEKEEQEKIILLKISQTKNGYKNSRTLLEFVQGVTSILVFIN